MTKQAHQPLTEERFERIKARSEAFRNAGMGHGTNAAYDSAADVPRLLAEVSRLRAENTAQARQLDAVRAIEPRQRTGLTTPTLLAEVSGWNGAVATLRAALGLDQDGAER